MASNETVAESIKMTKVIFLRDIGKVNERCEWCRGKLSDQLNRIESAHKREIAAKDAEIAELRNGISELLDALQTIYNEECTSYGTEEVYNKWRKALEGGN